MWFDSDADLLPGLLPGLFRGVTFFVPDTSITSGRRVAEYLFPGVDLAAYDDFGLYPSDVPIEGLIVGDDYIAQATALEAAFQVPGPATLIHPWRGPMTVMLREPGTISFSSKELRVARISVSFVRIDGAASGIAFSSLSGLTSAISAVSFAASALSRAVNTKVISTSRLKAADRSHRVVVSAVSSLATPTGARNTVSRLVASLPTVSVNPLAFDAMMVAIAGRLAQVAPVSAVSPAANAITEPMPAPAALVQVGNALASSMLVQLGAAPSSADASLLIAASAHVTAAMARQAVQVVYDSRDAALAYRATASGLLGGQIDAIEELAAGLMSGEASTLRRALRDLQSAVVLDVNETLGRLPSVKIFEPGRPIDAFQLAAHIAGDRPGLIEAVYLDIVARNRPRHPAQVDRERIEVKL